ncbi:hypothetical protein SAMN02982985_03217 [Rugamonas rubra]|uniref:Uncharacterized protein n=1 Tax=Rugamonas rubra TaxID=758825 RepID=A0A1I4P207_9BURK|nr:hypothetical protein SAMN02982985_03217 [Rugamonas rubra]
MVNWICICVAGLAALGLYLASPHQTLWRAALARATLLRWLALPLLAGAVASAASAYGAWCGVCIALAGFMMTLVALPYLDAGLHGRKPAKAGARHVG